MEQEKIGLERRRKQPDAQLKSVIGESRRDLIGTNERLAASEVPGKIDGLRTTVEKLGAPVRIGKPSGGKQIVSAVFLDEADDSIVVVISVVVHENEKFVGIQGQKIIAGLRQSAIQIAIQIRVVNIETEVSQAKPDNRDLTAPFSINGQHLRVVRHVVEHDHVLRPDNLRVMRDPTLDEERLVLGLEQ